MPDKQTVCLLLCWALLALAAMGRANGREIVIDDYRNGLAAGWRTKSFAGQTHYTVERNNNQSWIKATSHGSASGLIYKIEYDPRHYPILTWSWRVENVLAKGDARRKEGDDYAARVYVVFPSPFFWKTRALNYIWANRLPRGSMVKNAYTANAMMIAVQSGPGETGRWHTEQRNVYEDFRKAFGEEPPMVGAIAIMTDTDNTGETATAFYGPIKIGDRP